MDIPDKDDDDDDTLLILPCKKRKITASNTAQDVLQKLTPPKKAAPKTLVPPLAVIATPTLSSSSATTAVIADTTTGSTATSGAIPSVDVGVASSTSGMISSTISVASSTTTACFTSGIATGTVVVSLAATATVSLVPRVTIDTSSSLTATQLATQSFPLQSMSIPIAASETQCQGAVAALVPSIISAMGASSTPSGTTLVSTSGSVFVGTELPTKKKRFSLRWNIVTTDSAGKSPATTKEIIHRGCLLRHGDLLLFLFRGHLQQPMRGRDNADE
ncbi:hypothetical protein NE237_025095 [Protea cynaroides]|uniref:Uncharacterized protein n=1 Tax=Protea cynaroides TaxID=273540 RepID=A0A9Q0H6E2_9MAGN|nr:hypothetical protein NE237_025095 [Protea cynaroides]